MIVRSSTGSSRSIHRFDDGPGEVMVVVLCLEPDCGDVVGRFITQQRLYAESMS